MIATRLRELVIRRPGLVLLAALYVAVAALVARTPATVALCALVLVAVTVQVVAATRGPLARRRPGRPTRS